MIYDPRYMIMMAHLISGSLKHPTFGVLVKKYSARLPSAGRNSRPEQDLSPGEWGVNPPQKWDLTSKNGIYSDLMRFYSDLMGFIVIQWDFIVISPRTSEVN